MRTQEAFRVFSCIFLSTTNINSVSDRIVEPKGNIFAKAMEITCSPNSISLDSNSGSWYLYSSEKEILNQNFNRTEGEPRGPNQSGHDFSEVLVQFEDLAPSTSSGRPRDKDIGAFGQATGSAYPPFLDAEGVSNEDIWKFLEPNELGSIKHHQGHFWPWVSKSEVSYMSTFI